MSLHELFNHRDLATRILPRDLAARLWKRSEAPADIQPGNRFSRRRRDNVTETATVIELRQDPFGIPHVRFSLAFEQPSLGCVNECLRVLALASFVDAYRERLA
jgi:hypothetical protein